MIKRQKNAQLKKLDWIIRILIVAILGVALSIVFVFLPKQEDASAVKVRTMMLYDAYVGQPYSLTLEPLNGKGPFVFEVSGLPDGLSYDSSTQSILGSAEKSGSYEVSVKVTDAENRSDTVKYKFAVADTEPAAVAGPISPVSGGRFYSAAVLENGDLVTWGDNHNGQLGRLIEGKYTAEAEKALLNVKSVHAGSTATFAVRKDGTLWAFGQNDSGQFGNGSTTNELQPTFIMDKVAMVAGGPTYTMIIKDDNTLWAFGTGKFYQLGNGSTNLQTSPVKILDDVVSVSCGEYTAFAVKKDGTVWTWGQNARGEAGLSDSEKFIKTPVQITGLSDIVCVSANYGHTLALDKNGAVWTWGVNEKGQLGSGNTEDVNEPVKIMDNVRAISVGIDHSLALSNDGELFGSGSNEFGQLGTGVDGDTSSFVKIADGISQVYAGGYHTLIVNEDSELLAMGRNDNGQLGIGNTDSTSEPVKVLSLK